jgi:Fe-S-cluster containining protein
MPLDAYEALLQSVSEHADALFEHYRPHLQCRFGCYFCCTRISVLPIEYEAIRRKLARDGYPEAARLGGPPEDTGAEPADVAATGGPGVGAAPADAPDGTAPGDQGRVSVDRTTHGTFPAPKGRAERCGFLGTRGECTIYEQRPAICRTHGLPLAYTVYEYDQAGKQIEPENPEKLDLWCDLNFTSLSDKDARNYFDQHGRIDQSKINEELERLNDEFLNTAEGARYQGMGRLYLDRLLSEPGR